MSLDDEVRAELAGLAAAHRLRTPRVVDGRPGALITIDGREVLDLASNDYLGLAGDPRLVRAASASLEAHGSGAGASRLITGNHREHVELEAALADWLEREGVRLFNSGYAANVGVLTTLAGDGDVVFSDELNHASIIDGCRLSRARIVVYPHRDLAALDAALRQGGGRRRLVVSESLFSMDGDVADVVGLAALCARHEASLILDEAHAIGALGPQGRGIAAEQGVVPAVVIGTFGKALGSFGAFAASSGAIAELLWNRARSLVFSTGLPPSVSAATRAALEIVRGADGDARRRRLATNAQRFRSLVPRAGGASTSAIAPIVVGDDQRVMELSARLLAAQLFVQGIRPPTVPSGSARLRVSLSSEISAQQLETAGTLIDNAVR